MKHFLGPQPAVKLQRGGRTTRSHAVNETVPSGTRRTKPCGGLTTALRLRVPARMPQWLNARSCLPSGRRVDQKGAPLVRKPGFARAAAGDKRADEGARKLAGTGARTGARRIMIVR